MDLQPANKSSGYNNNTVGPESDLELEITTIFHSEYDKKIKGKLALERVPENENSSTSPSKNSPAKPQYSLSLQEIENRCPFGPKNYSFLILNKETGIFEDFSDKEIINDLSNPVEVQVLPNRSQIVENDISNENYQSFPHSTRNLGQNLNNFYPHYPMNNHPVNYNFDGPALNQHHSSLPHDYARHNFQYPVPNNNYNVQIASHQNRMGFAHSQYPSYYPPPPQYSHSKMHHNPHFNGVESSTTYENRHTNWFDGVSSCGQSMNSMSSRMSGFSQQKFSKGKDLSVVSHSTNSIVNLHHNIAQIQEIEYSIDFTKISNPLLEWSYIESKFFVTKFGNEFAKIGLSQLDILMKIDDNDLSEIDQDFGDRIIRKMLCEKKIVRLTIGRLSKSKELDNIRKIACGPILDSVSFFPSKSSGSIEDKENIYPSSKSTEGQDVVSFLTGESSLDDIRHNLTLDTSLYNIVRAMMHPDSKLERKTRSHCSIKYQNSFTGNQLVQWLLAYVKGLHTPKDAKALAQKFMNARLIKCPLFGANPSGFSENTLYTFVANLAEHQKYLLEIQDIPEESQTSFGAISSIKNQPSNSSDKNKKEPAPIQRNGSIRRSGKFASLV